MNFNAPTGLVKKAITYSNKNPERFNEEEKQNFFKSLNNFCNGDPVLTDEVYDFLVAEGFINLPTRSTTFANYIKQKYSPKNYKKVLDVGAGRMCHLSKNLAQSGFKVYAMDPNIRLTEKEASLMKIKQIIKLKFACDQYPINNKSTDVNNYDLLIGLEPCDATEHIIRQGLAHDKPFDVLLCFAPHNALNGTEFKSVDEWYKHLKSISNEIDIIKKGSSYIATNNL